MTFKEYLQNLEGDLNLDQFFTGPEQDFIGDSINNDKFSTNINSAESLENFLIMQNACIEAIDAGLNIFKGYQIAMGKQ